MSESCDPRDCPVNTRLDGLEKEFDRYRSASSETHRQMFERIGALEQSGAAVTAKLDGMDGKLDKVVEWQEAQMGKPGKRWDSMVDKAVWAVLAAVIAFLLGRLGL